jgi:hypothetical protein
MGWLKLGIVGYFRACVRRNRGAFCNISFIRRSFGRGHAGYSSSLGELLAGSSGLRMRAGIFF